MTFLGWQPVAADMSQPGSSDAHSVRLFNSLAQQMQQSGATVVGLLCSQQVLLADLCACRYGLRARTCSTDDIYARLQNGAQPRPSVRPLPQTFRRFLMCCMQVSTVSGLAGGRDGNNFRMFLAPWLPCYGGRMVCLECRAGVRTGRHANWQRGEGVRTEASPCADVRIYLMRSTGNPAPEGEGVLLMLCGRCCSCLQLDPAQCWSIETPTPTPPAGCAALLSSIRCMTY
jgi:hypothetical protein